MARDCLSCSEHWKHEQAENQAMLADVVAAISRGELNPVEPVAYPLDRVADALRDQFERRVTGKSVLVP